LSQERRRERENFLRDIEKIVNENPALKKKTSESLANSTR